MGFFVAFLRTNFHFKSNPRNQGWILIEFARFFPDDLCGEKKWTILKISCYSSSQITQSSSFSGVAIGFGCRRWTVPTVLDGSVCFSGWLIDLMRASGELAFFGAFFEAVATGADCRRDTCTAVPSWAFSVGPSEGCRSGATVVHTPSPKSVRPRIEELSIDPGFLSGKPPLDLLID